MEWKPLELSQKETDFIEYQQYIARRIAGIFGLSLKDLGVIDGSITVPVYMIQRKNDGE